MAFTVGINHRTKWHQAADLSEESVGVLGGPSYTAYPLYDVVPADDFVAADDRPLTRIDVHGDRKSVV